MNIKSRERRQKSIRAKISGTKDRPRVSVFRSNQFIFAQLIDDDKKQTILGLSEKSIKEGGTKVEKAKNLGLTFAKNALAKKVKKVVFDRGGYAYHGRIKAFADGAREGGLEF